MSAPDRIYFNGAVIVDHMHVSTVPFAGGTPHLRATPSRENAEELAEALRQIKREFSNVRGGHRAEVIAYRALAKLEKDT